MKWGHCVFLWSTFRRFVVVLRNLKSVLSFAQEYTALSAVEMLNSMARAKKLLCQRAMNFALPDYTDPVSYTTER